MKNEKTIHLFEDHVYLISNYAVARNPLFDTKELQDYFIDKMEHHLFPICEIINYNLGSGKFEILLKLKPREVMEEHYNSYNKGQQEAGFVPESTYIFSQAMANLQVSYVKHFNYVNKRKGSLMAERFQRQLVETEEEMNKIIDRMNSLGCCSGHTGIWSCDEEETEAVNGSWISDDEEIKIRSGKGYLNVNNIYLGEWFKNLPPKKLSSTKSYFESLIFKSFRMNFSP